MKESINTALILNLVITFLFIFVILFAGSSAYTKAFKVKNRIISIIEKRQDTILTSGFKTCKTTGNSKCMSVVEEIENALKDTGYKVQMNTDKKCENAMQERFKNTHKTYNTVNTGSNTYNYCIAEFYSNNDTMKGRYYAVITYMYFEIPLINQMLEFPVYGETKTIGLSY